MAPPNKRRGIPPPLVEEAHPLEDIFAKAIEQAENVPVKETFMERPWLGVAKIHGAGYLTGWAQACLEKAVLFHSPYSAGYAHELREALIRIGQALLYVDEVLKKEGEDGD